MQFTGQPKPQDKTDLFKFGVRCVVVAIAKEQISQILGENIQN